MPGGFYSGKAKFRSLNQAFGAGACASGLCNLPSQFPFSFLLQRTSCFVQSRTQDARKNPFRNRPAIPYDFRPFPPGVFKELKNTTHYTLLEKGRFSTFPSLSRREMLAFSGFGGLIAKGSKEDSFLPSFFVLGLNHCYKAEAYKFLLELISFSG